jgi:hypothetical protein
VTGTALLIAGLSAAAATLVVRGARRTYPGRHAESILAGLTGVAVAIGFLSAGATARLLFGVPALVAWAVAVAAVAFAWTRKAPRGIPPRPNVQGPRTSRGVLAVFAAGVALGTYVVVTRLVRVPDGEWDAVAFWALRARLFHTAHGDLATVFSTEMPGSHPDYPLMLPGAIAWGGMAFGDASSLASALPALVFGAIAVVGLFAAAAGRRGVVPACLATTALLAAPHFARQLSWRYADVQVAALLLLACGWLVAAHERPEGARGSLALAGLCASLGAWSKNDGAAHLVALALVAGAMPPPGLSRRAAWTRFAAGAAPFTALLLVFKATLAPANDLVEESTLGGALSRVADPSRYLAVARELLSEVVRTSHWNLLLPAAVLVAALGRTRTRGTRAVALVVGAVALAYVAVYVLTPKGLELHLRTSLERLLMHLYPSLLLLAALRAAPGDVAEPPVDPYAARTTGGSPCRTISEPL